MESITQYEAVKISLRSMMELKHPWAFSFFHWWLKLFDIRPGETFSVLARLMGTNRYHFALIPEANRLKEIVTSQQYFIKHEDIVKHVNFKKQRAQHGSVFAFHGSPQENWHSILRSGLRIGHGAYLVRDSLMERLTDITGCLIDLAQWCCPWYGDLCFTRVSFCV